MVITIARIRLSHVNFPNLGLALFNIFVADMDGRIECTPSKLSDNTEMCSAVSMLGERDAI